MCSSIEGNCGFVKSIKKNQVKTKRTPRNKEYLKNYNSASLFFFFSMAHVLFAGRTSMEMTHQQENLENSLPFSPLQQVEAPRPLRLLPLRWGLPPHHHFLCDQSSKWRIVRAGVTLVTRISSGLSPLHGSLHNL